MAFSERLLQVDLTYIAFDHLISNYVQVAIKYDDAHSTDRASDKDFGGARGPVPL
jgi:hypothetical protein